MIGWVHSLVVVLGKYLLGDHLAAEVFSYARKKSVKEYWSLTRDKHDLIREFYDKVYRFDIPIRPGLMPNRRSGTSMTSMPLSLPEWLYLRCLMGSTYYLARCSVS